MTFYDLRFENKFSATSLSSGNCSKNYILSKRILENLEKYKKVDPNLDGISLKIRLGTFLPSNNKKFPSQNYFKPSISPSNFSTLFHNYITNTDQSYTTERTVAYTLGKDKLYRENNRVYVFKSNLLSRYDVKTKKDEYDLRVDISYNIIKEGNVNLEKIAKTAFRREKEKTIFVNPLDPCIHTNFLVVKNRHKDGKVEKTFEIELELLVDENVKKGCDGRKEDLGVVVVRTLTVLQTLLDVGK